MTDKKLVRSLEEPSMISHINKKPKKIVIKNFKERPKLSENYFSESWDVLRRATRSVFDSQPIPQGLEELYKICENLCHQRMSDVLYGKLRGECEAQVKSVSAQLSVAMGDDQNLLNELCKAWKSFCQQLIMIRCIFLYLDRTYILQTAGSSSLWDMGLEIFRDLVTSNASIKARTVRGILNLVEKERYGHSIDRGMLRVLVGMLLDLGIYQDFLELPLFIESETYYKRDGLSQFDRCPVPEYLQYIENRISEEITRVQGYLCQTSKRTLIEIVEKELLVTHISAILEKGFAPMMDAASIVDLKRLYSLFNGVKSVSHIKIAFFNYAKAKGLEIVMNEERDASMVTDLLEFKGKLDGIIAESFGSNEAFSQSLKDAFERFINQRANKPAELIAKYMDFLLKGSGGNMTETETDASLDKTLVLFRYVQGKDMFEAFYKNDLAKRLLFGKSASFDAEKLMLTKLKSECGSGFTSKLEGMFRDIELSRTIMTSFKQKSAHTSIIKDLDFNVNVLTSSNWPTYLFAEIKLPPFMNECLEVFKGFYLSLHKGRKLVWQHDKSSCVLKVNLEKYSRELVVSLFQSIVLLLFNEKDTHGFREIRDASGIEEVELKKVLQSLACGKVRILVKEPKGREVMDDDVFHFNVKFTSNHYRVKINAIQIKETAMENEVTAEKVVQDRQYLIDAAIVRIMKTRKRLSHKSLISELFQQLKFPVAASDLKNRIESLIERDYLERVAGDSSIYEYLA